MLWGIVAAPEGAGGAEKGGRRVSFGCAGTPALMGNGVIAPFQDERCAGPGVKDTRRPPFRPDEPSAGAAPPSTPLPRPGPVGPPAYAGAALVGQALEREMRRRAAARDAAILAREGAVDDLDELVAWMAGSFGPGD